MTLPFIFDKYGSLDIGNDFEVVQQNMSACVKDVTDKNFDDSAQFKPCDGNHTEKCEHSGFPKGATHRIVLYLKKKEQS